MIRRFDTDETIANPPRQTHQDPEFERALAQEMFIESVTEKLLELMDQEDVSRAELARRIGKGRSFITQILDGSRNMTLRTVADLAFALGHQLVVEERPRAEVSRARALENQLEALVSHHRRTSGALHVEIRRGEPSCDAPRIWAALEAVHHPHHNWPKGREDTGDFSIPTFLVTPKREDRLAAEKSGHYSVAG